MQASKTINFEVLKRFILISLGGCLLALLTWKLMTLNFRHGVALTGLVVFLSICGIFARKFEDFLIYSIVFNIPFSIFEKWYFFREEMMPSPGISVGLSGVLLLLAYLMWFGQIFITRTKPPPKIGTMEVIIALSFIGQLISTFFAADKVVASFDIIYTVKHILMYLFLANKVHRKHLMGIVLLMLFTVGVESGVAAYERITGNVNIAVAKGDSSSENFGAQYEVTGIEHETRAAGTTNDSHSLGLYFAMLLPIPFVLLATRESSPILRLLCAGALMCGILGLVITFSRSGWLAFAVAATVASLVIIFSWRQGKSILVIAVILLFASALYPQAYVKVYNRVFEAPPELMTGRGDMIDSAIVIWKENLFFGVGPGNYTNAFKEKNLYIDKIIDGLPVHNAFFYSGAELGIFGCILFYATLFQAIRIGWRVQKRERGIPRALALALMVAVIAYISDGMTSPMYRATPIYMHVWFTIALIVAIDRFPNEKSERIRPPSRRQSNRTLSVQPDDR